MNISNLSTVSSHVMDSETKSRAKLFHLPGKCFEKHVGCAWRRGNKFSIYPRSQTTESNTPATENMILNIRQDISLFHPILRKFVNESNGTFLALQKAAEAAKASDNQVEFLKLSRQYRSIIRVCIEGLQEENNKATDGLEKSKLMAFITIFYSIECIWHLGEILYFDNVPGDIVLPFLLEWVRFHFPCHEQSAAQFLESCERGSEDHKDYWDTVIGMVVQGRVDVARALMRLHSASESNEFKLVDNSLRTMPVYNVYGGISTGEFTVAWRHWQAECRAKVASQVLASQPKLQLIMKLIIGDYGAFSQVRAKYASWFDVLGGWVQFTAPCARRHELAPAAAAAAGMAAAPRTALDRTVRALLDGDTHQVLHEIQQLSDGGWFATHLTDILHHSGHLTLLDKQQNNISGQLRESLVLEYGAGLMEHPSLWSAGLSYLATCHDAGLRRAELLLERIPVPTEAKAMRVIAEAKKYGLLGVVQTVSTVTSTRLLSRGRVGGALYWGVRGGTRGSGAAAHAALRGYSEKGALPATDLLLSAGACIMAHDATLFLGKYCDFHRLYKNKEFQRAADLLVSLITSKIAPDYFWPTLLVDTLPLLECDTPVFSFNATCIIMECLELKGAALDGERASLLRLALARNAARAALQYTPIENK